MSTILLHEQTLLCNSNLPSVTNIEGEARVTLKDDVTTGKMLVGGSALLISETGVSILLSG